MQRILLVLGLSFVVTACAGAGKFPQATVTAVNLSKQNFRVIKAGAQGESMGVSLLGLIPIVPPSVSKAKKDLYSSVGAEMVNKATALSNVTEERSTLYLILISLPRITLTADVIEFLAEAPSSASSESDASSR